MNQNPASIPDIRLGISACLLGEPVRYDGGHKLDHFLRDTLSRFVTWIPICPEAGCGLPVPREPMRLVKQGGRIRLSTVETLQDHTERIEKWAVPVLDELETMECSGYVFKSRSPSCGPNHVRVFKSGARTPSKSGTGVFARMFMERFPLIPVENEERFHDPERRESFIRRVFVWKRWLNFLNSGQNSEKLTDFHAKHELLIVAHSRNRLRVLGNLAASIEQLNPNTVKTSYIALLMNTLKHTATRSRQVNALQHAARYIKKRLGMAEWTELTELIERYRVGYVPLEVPVALLRSYAKRFNELNLERQVYLNSNPVEQMLKDHI